MKHFLNQVEYEAETERISLDFVLMDIHHLLKDDAYRWFFPKRNQFYSWADFKTAIQEQFLDDDHDELIKQNLEDCKQGNNEHFSKFLSRFELLADELQVPLNDSEKLRKLKKNVNLHFAEKVHMMDFNNCNGFIAACRKVQNFINVRDSQIHNSNQIRNDFHVDNYFSPRGNNLQRLLLLLLLLLLK